MSKEKVKKKNGIKNPPKGGKDKKQPQKKRSWLGWSLKWVFVLGLWAGIFLTALVGWYASELPSITRNATFERSPSLTITDQRGDRLIRYGEIKGINHNVRDLPPNLAHAVISIEDRRFYDHFGLDPMGLARAMAVNVQAGRIVQGGSTITQQLAKNLFLDQERTLKRKIQEALLALWLERTLNKDQILSAYLNRVYLGSGTYGVEAASQLYFGKPATELNLQESAVIAGLLKAPSRYSPLNNKDLAYARAQTVLNAMKEEGYITVKEAKGSDDLYAFAPRPKAKPSLLGGNDVQYFTDWVVEGLDDLIGTPQEDLIIQTTLDPAVQNAASRALNQILNAHGNERNMSQGAVLAMRHDGAIVAMVGGRNYSDSQFNRAVLAQRAPGSSFKTILYLNALQKGFDPDDKILDAPIERGNYRPANYDSEYKNEDITLEEALANSSNTAAIRLMQASGGPQATIDLARTMGIISPLDRDLSLALGSSGISMLEMVVAYGMIANGGYRIYPYGLAKIEDDQGTLVYQKREERQSERVIESKNIRAIDKMLEAVIDYGTGRRAQTGFKVAGKTGTSQAYRDAWFIGYSDQLIVAVWLGNDDNSPMKAVTGGSFPAQIWRDVMIADHENDGAIIGRIQKSSDSLFGSLLDTLTGSFDAIDIEVEKPAGGYNN